MVALGWLHLDACLGEGDALESTLDGIIMNSYTMHACSTTLSLLS